jgi:hypothetical protein
VKVWILHFLPDNLLYGKNSSQNWCEFTFLAKINEGTHLLRIFCHSVNLFCISAFGNLLFLQASISSFSMATIVLIMLCLTRAAALPHGLSRVRELHHVG